MDFVHSFGNRHVRHGENFGGAAPGEQTDRQAGTAGGQDSPR